MTLTLLFVFGAAVFTIFALRRMVAPFLGDDSEALQFEHFDEAIREIELLTARRDVLLTALRELDFERETDKLTPEDYERFHRRYEREAVQIMRRLDDLHGGQGWQERVNSELEERLGGKSLLAGEPPDEEPSEDLPTAETIEAEDESHEGSEEADQDLHEASDLEEASSNGDSEPPAETCSGCEQPLEPDDRFCSQCGTPVVAVEPEEPPSASEVSA